MAGDGKQQTRGNKGVGNPPQAVADRSGRSQSRLRLSRHFAPAVAEPTQRNAADQQAESCRPYPALLDQRQGRLNEQRIRQQRQEAAGIAGCVEKVWILGAGVISPRKPPLK
ncbi:MAG: hypothetical protein JO282_00700 [Alphaproteobacteria bacterium]|nr:hypothetical protein [Alphaproteobacteria bacterium]